MENPKSMRSRLGRVRGLGSSGTGTEHFWVQRVSAVALIPLTLIFTVMVLRLVGAEQAAVAETFGNPLAAAVALLLIIAGYWHLKLGLQTVIEDYMHNEACKLAAQLSATFVCAGAGAAAVVAVLKLAVMG